MYNLSPRWRRTVSNTPDLVGPTTYLLCGDDVCHQAERALSYPFSSTSKSERGISNPNFCDTFYFIRDGKKIKGGSSLGNKALRFPISKLDDSPGPGSYRPELCNRCKKLDPKPPEGKGRLYLCHVEFNYGVSAPSIPSRIDENGYDLDPEGALIKVPANPIKECVGPADYDITQCSCCNCERYKGCDWSSSKTKRFKSNIDDIPGPGTYNFEIPKDPQKESIEEYRQMARLFTYLPRYLEDQQIKKMRENLPGPSEYLPEILECKQCPAINRRPFITQSQRFKRDDEESPGPTDYDITSPRKIIREKCCPTSGDSGRFPKSNLNTTPGPGAYDVKSPIQQKLDEKFNKYSAVRVPFNHTAQRMLSKDDGGPGPTAYTIENSNYCKKTIGSSGFRSKVNRFPQKCREHGPADTSDLNASFLMSQCQKTHNVKKHPFNIKSPKKDTIPIKEGPGKQPEYRYPSN